MEVEGEDKPYVVSVRRRLGSASDRHAFWWATPRRVGFVILLARVWITTGTYDRVALGT